MPSSWVGANPGERRLNTPTAGRYHRAHLDHEKGQAALAKQQQQQHARGASLSPPSTLVLGSSSANTSSAASRDSLRQPYAMRFGRCYLSQPDSQYPLPIDLPELHRQVLRTMLLVAVFGGPLCSPTWRTKPPKKVLEVGCGNAYWSVLCHKHFAAQGHSVSFTGIDIAPVADKMRASGMEWRFVQHDFQRAPLPFEDEEFDVIMFKDLSLISSAFGFSSNLLDNFFRCLRPGGQMEIWDGDHTIRMMCAHAQANAQDSGSGEEERARADDTGTYTTSSHTPFKPPSNQYLADYNAWVTQIIDQRGLTTIPCTLMGMLLLQESQLTDVNSRRVAIPLGEIRWELDGELEHSAVAKESEPSKRRLTEAQAAIRHTALLTLVQFIEDLEPFLREVSGKTQSEWDRWYGEMMDDLFNKNGTAWGESLEVGAWWATKKTKPIPKGRTKSKPPPPQPDVSDKPEEKASVSEEPRPGGGWAPPEF